MIKKFKKSYFKILSYIILLILSLIVLLPVIFMVCGSFMGKSEILNSYGNTISSSGSENYFHIIPEQATLKGYLDVFLLDPAYLMKFWVSIMISVAIVIGQVVIVFQRLWSC